MASVWLLSILGVIILGVVTVVLLRCWCQGKSCSSKGRIDGKVVVITGGDTTVGIELVRDLCRRGAEKVIMAVENVVLGQDIAVEIKGETNGDVVVEYCDMASLKSVRAFCSKILECESRVHILINHATVMWYPFKVTAEGHEYHWGVNHLAHFVMTQLLMPLLLRGTPDARVITLSSSWHRQATINWHDPNFMWNESSASATSDGETVRRKPSTTSRTIVASSRDYSAFKAFNQSKLANILFTRELARRMNGTGVNSYSVDPGIISTGLGWHILSGLDCFRATAATCCWLPWMKSTEYSISTTVYCATEPLLSEQSGLHYRDCAPALTSEEGANLDSAYRLWEMTERIVGLTS